MKSGKQEVQDLLRGLPDDVSLENVIIEMQHRASIRRGFDELRRGEGISHEDLKAKLSAWRESFGRRKPADA
jgi:hypothetical protein